MIFFSVLGFIVIVLLAGIATYFHWKLHSQRKRLAETKATADVYKKGSKQSIVILSRAIIAQQVSLTEASIRISTLLNAITISDSDSVLFNGFFQLAEATSHIPILDEWKKLDKLQKRHYELEREVLEKQYQERIMYAAEKIASGYVF